jgi:hypothetical protein
MRRGWGRKGQSGWTGQPARLAGRTVQRTHRKDMIMHAWKMVGGGGREKYMKDRTGQGHGQGQDRVMVKDRTGSWSRT